MRNLLAFLLLTSLVGTAGAASAPRVENMKKATVLVTNEGFLGGGRGSGILMDSTHVLTCAHMADTIKDEFFVYVYPLGVVAKAHIENINVTNDLLMLKLDAPVHLSVKPVFQSKVTDGETITVVGNAWGSMKWYVTRGVISGAERDYVMTDAAVNHGNSGGPWFNDAGEIVAISDWGIDQSHGYILSGITGGVSSKTVLATLKGWDDQKKLSAALMSLFQGKK